ncbi:DMT family transporter [Oceaniglobus trochenteri]|uniref:DMT family transporter n=1 Tax=Oceaniglobus trochenteri TaxID=2763260 RepID=UPI001CFF80D2|nr:DMT family transporter [Oceaniglobus trochenteri]
MTLPPRDNLRGGAWMLADMALNIWALSIVKALGLGFPPAQLVFLRAVIGLILIAPWVWRGRRVFVGVGDLSIHALRVGLSIVTLTASFFAIARLPFATFTALNFTRPVVTMVLAALVLRETIGLARWVAAGVALIGVVIAVEPSALPPGNGLPVLFLAICAGSAAVIATRRLRAAPTLVLMTFYTAGLALVTGPIAALSWVPIPPEHLVPLLSIGVFAQCAQACFLRAQFHGEAGFLSVLGYLSLIFSGLVGYFVFDEVPTPAFALGAVLVVGAALSVSYGARRRRAPAA